MFVHASKLGLECLPSIYYMSVGVAHAAVHKSFNAPSDGFSSFAHLSLLTEAYDLRIAATPPHSSPHR